MLAPHKRIAPKIAHAIKWLTPSKPRTMVGGLWRIDANFKSSIYLRNIVETDPVTVTPILYLSNGNKYTLPDVTVEPAGVAIISINDALQKMGISSWATLTGYVEIQYTWPWDPFCATVRNVDTVHSLIFTYFLRPTLPSPLPVVHPVAKTPTQTTEGMWWKQESNVTAFVAVANLSPQPAQASVQVTDQLGNPLSEHNVTISPHGMKTVNLSELATLNNTLGGIRIVSSETTDNLVVNGGLEDEAVGYSATLPFAADPVEASQPRPINIAELGLMTGAADPMMFFPAGTTFTPYSVLRNVSDAPVSLTPTLWWMEGAAPHSAELPAISLLPYQTQSLDMKSLLSRYGPKNFNGSFNLVFGGEAKPGALVISSGSVDQTNNYVFEAPPRGIAEGGGKSLQYWSTGNGDDTMITVWNPADEAQDFVFTLFFTGGHYALPLHLEPRATRGFNISEIIQNQVPDAEGNLIPPSVHEGSAKLSGSLAENQHILVAVGAGVYNVRKATCGDICNQCDGYTQAQVLADPFAVAVNGTHGLSIVGTYNTGGQYDGLSGTWSSNNTSVATVGSTGVVSGMSSGTAYISAITGYEPVGVGYTCYDPFQNNGQCPQDQFSGTSAGSVTMLRCPSSVARGSTATCTVTPTSGVAVSGWQFKDGSGNTVTRTTNTGSLTWSGVEVTGGTVSVTATASGTSFPLTASIAVTARSTNFAFTAVNPTQVAGNSITCYGGATTTLPSPPVPTSSEGASCADLAFSFTSSAPIADNGPNNGYQYVTSVSSTSGSQATQFQYIVVSDLLSATTFYNAQCGTYSSSNSSGFIAGSQLKQNVLDHEQGSVLSHWTEYVNAQNNSGNNVGTVLEAAVGAPGTSQSGYQTSLTNDGRTAVNNILTAVAVEPCNGSLNDDSSQSCVYCGTINSSPYQSCGTSQPVAHCQ